MTKPERVSLIELAVTFNHIALASFGGGLSADTLGDAVSAERSQPFYLDVTHPEANKGAVAMTLSKLHDIQLAEFATIGDMPNDVPMFRKSGFSIAMGNASDEVKAEASAVTDSNGHEGFAKAVRRFIMQPATT